MQQHDLGYRWFEEVWNKKRRDAVAEMLAPDAVLHDGATHSKGPEGFYPFFDRIHGSLSDIRMSVQLCVAEGDLLCVRWTCNATHTGHALGIPPSGKALEITGITIVRVANGKVAEGWQNWDMMGMMEQIRGEQKVAATYIGA